ncbi:DUF952 domain-containing protein [Actinomadura decatromicini]|uniref:DUF952 domain-containing protein n=1 Tax=Actinomadura decatromicini TaxID=2604572 RepID=A0A5D3FQV6_9ACTN|nr:DUF952 domain-containing protein [Actinomadura decatromicini]TYK50721.1 DUF952 domain-containing protein [Actinomadura decatromicini]
MSVQTLLHIAERTHWQNAVDSDTPYTMSTLGRTLDDEGFIHCSSDLAQVDGVLGRFYTAVPRSDLVLLVIDVSRLDAPVRYEPAGDEVFPHVYGPIPPAAVIETKSLPENR